MLYSGVIDTGAADVDVHLWWFVKGGSMTR